MVRLFGGSVGGRRWGMELARGLVVALAVVALCLVVPGKASATNIALTNVDPNSAMQGETVKIDLDERTSGVRACLLTFLRRRTGQ